MTFKQFLQILENNDVWIHVYIFGHPYTAMRKWFLDYRTFDSNFIHAIETKHIYHIMYEPDKNQFNITLCYKDWVHCHNTGNKVRDFVKACHFMEFTGFVNSWDGMPFGGRIEMLLDRAVTTDPGYGISAIKIDEDRYPKQILIKFSKERDGDNK